MEQQQGTAKTCYKSDNEARVQLLCNHCCKTKTDKGLICLLQNFIC